MGHLIATGSESNGHGFEFEYSKIDGLDKCQMVCNCGWNTDIKSFQNPWSVIEVKVKIKEHLADFGIEAYHPGAIFDFKDYKQA